MILSGVSEPRRHTFSLSLMMFLQYAVWGVWLPYLANYLLGPTKDGGLGFTGAQVGWILGLAASIGAVSAPFLAGQIADRFMNAEKYLALLLISGGIIKYITASVHDYHAFIIASIIYSVLYMPTLALTNSIAFCPSEQPRKQFPSIRVWGTIGWIYRLQRLPLLWLPIQFTSDNIAPFHTAGIDKPNATRPLGRLPSRRRHPRHPLRPLGRLRPLPATPPTKDQQHPFAFAKAFALLKHPGFLIVTLGSHCRIAMIQHQVYFIRTGPFIEYLGFCQKPTSVPSSRSANSPKSSSSSPSSASFPRQTRLQIYSSPSAASPTPPASPSSPSPPPIAPQMARRPPPPSSTAFATAASSPALSSTSKESPPPTSATPHKPSSASSSSASVPSSPASTTNTSTN